jgi:hypothetical protein
MVSYPIYIFIYLYAKMKISSASKAPLTIGALFIGYKLQIRLGWVEIPMKLGIQPNTTQMLYERVLSA